MTYNDYNEDPYNYDNGSNPYDYGQNYEPAPVPPPDKNWIDPVPVVRKYLKRIQQDCIQEEFKDLRETSLYQLEVLIEHLELNKDHNLSPKQGQTLVTQVKFLTMDFLEIGGEKVTENTSSLGSYRSPSFTDMFQNLYTETGRYRHLSKGSSPGVMVGDEEHEKDAQPLPKHSSKDVVTVEIDKGKSVLLALSGLEIIQSLQRHPVKVRVRVMQTDAAGESTAEAEVVSEAVATVKWPESFRQAVLVDSSSEAVLPTSAVSSRPHPLQVEDSTQVGVAQLTLSLTCLGRAVINCLRQAGYKRFNFEHTMILKTLTKQSHISEDSPKMPLDYRNWIPDVRTSEQILRACISSGVENVDSKTRASLLGDCHWFKMAQDALPKKKTKAHIKQKKDPRVVLDCMWRANKRFCHELMEDKGKNHRPSVLDRLDSLMTDIDVTQLEGSNALLGQVSPTESLENQKSSRPSKGSRRKSTLKSGSAKRGS